MNKIIACMNNKGGCGKTTLAVNLACELSKQNQKVLLIDLDGLCCVNYVFNKSKQKTANQNILQFLKNKIKLTDVIIEFNNNLSFIAADQDLQKFDNIQFFNEVKEHLIQFLDWLKNKSMYDFIIIDSAPQMSDLNALITKYANLVVIPFEVEQTNLFSLISTIEFLESNNKVITKLLVPNKVKLDKETNKLKLNKTSTNFYKQLVSSIENNCNNAIVSQNPIIFSNQFKNCIFKYDLPITAIPSQSKIYEKPKKCFTNLAIEIANIK